jgi:hypothetical protein
MRLRNEDQPAPSMRSAHLIQASLVNAMEGGCDDLMTCATTAGCPLPFAEIARLPAESSSDPLLETAANLECTVPDVKCGELMNFVKGLLKAAVVAKLLQVAQQELTKPENQQKIKDGIGKLKEAAKSRR